MSSHPTPKPTILFLASSPDDQAPIRLDEEMRAIEQKINGSEHRNAFELESKCATRPDDLIQHLNAYRPTVVHFSGHGGEAGELVLMDEARRSKPVAPSALKALFSTLKGNIRLVVLNACYSKTQAVAIADVIDCVIGMNDEIGDTAAIKFAASFYRAVCFGCSVREAFEQGRVSLMLEGIPEESTPELIVRKGVNAKAIYLASDSISSRGRIGSAPSKATEVSYSQQKLVLDFGVSSEIPVNETREVFDDDTAAVRQWSG